MEKEKSNKGLIGVLIVIIILLLLALGYVLFGKELLNKNESNTTTNNLNNNNQSIDNQRLKKLSLDKDNCVSNIGNYYLDYDFYEINNVKIRNNYYIFKYYNYNNGIIIYLNDDIIYGVSSSELVLSKVCNYNDYLIVSRGWEGYDRITIFNPYFINEYEYIGAFTYNNGILTISEYSYENSNSYSLDYYDIDLTNETFTKKYIKTERIKCDNTGYNC